MSLNGANWSRNNESAHCDISQKAVLGRPGGGIAPPSRVASIPNQSDVLSEWFTMDIWHNDRTKGGGDKMATPLMLLEDG